MSITISIPGTEHLVVREDAERWLREHVVVERSALAAVAALAKRLGFYFARIEVQGYDDSWVSRVFRRGIYRKGGVEARETPKQKLSKIAKKLLWKGDLKELLEDGWVGEDSDWK